MPPLRVALVIFALWILVVEPTFGAYERFERHGAPTQHDRSDDNGCGDVDQQVPPREVTFAQWKNQHARADFAPTLLDPIGPMLHQPELAAIVPMLLPTHLSLPYQPSVAPLRL